MVPLSPGSNFLQQEDGQGNFAQITNWKVFDTIYKWPGETNGEFNLFYDAISADSALPASLCGFRHPQLYILALISTLLSPLCEDHKPDRTKQCRLVATKEDYF